MRDFELTLGLYPGILLGIRTYPQPHSTLHVLYLPFVDICLELFDDE